MTLTQEKIIKRAERYILHYWENHSWMPGIEAPPLEDLEDKAMVASDLIADLLIWAQLMRLDGQALAETSLMHMDAESMPGYGGG